jgi:hypothetical protein
MEENIVNTETTNGEEVVVPETAEETEVELTLEPEPEVDVAKLQEINKKLFARAKAAEAKLKTVAPKAEVPPTKKEINSNEQYLTREEAILIAKGYEESEIAKLQAIAKGNGCSLLDATKDEMFVVWKEKVVAENKKSKSQLGASKGSGSVRTEKSVAEMTPAEHEAYVMKMLGN